MKSLELKRQPSMSWTKLAMAGLMAAALAGCGGGSDGAAGPTGPTGPAGPTGPTGSTGPAAPGSVFNVGSNATPATDAAAAAWKALAPQVTVTGVTINSAPVVTFTVKNAAGLPVVGLGNKSQSSTATVAGMTNLGFTLAKLVPGRFNPIGLSEEPSKWVSYNVLRPVTVAEKGGTIGANSACNQTATAAATWCGTYPTTDTQGTLVDHGDGSYTYTFYRDPKQVKDIVAGLVDSTDGLSKGADLGDLTFDANATHRLGILITGNAPGTGNNNPAANATGAPAAVAIANPGNFTYDFIPATGSKVTATDASRNIVNISTCASCHQSKPLAHGGGRGNPELCVTCHTDQVKYSFNREAPMNADGITLTGGGATTVEKRANQAVIDGRAVGNFPNYIHKLHMGSGTSYGEPPSYEGLVKQGYNYNNDGGAMLFNQNMYPQDIRNCTTCHDGAATGAKATKDGDNWQKVPSMLACGSCHDGINFATGKGIAFGLAGKTVGGHVGGALTANSTCTTCHKQADIVSYHSAKLPATASAALRTMSATISGVAVDANGGVTAKFTVKDGDAAVTDLTKFKGVGFSLAKLVPAVNGESSHWVSYTSRFRTKDTTGKPPVLQGNKETAGVVTANADGSFSYKFALLNGSTPGDIRTIDRAQVLRSSGPAANTTVGDWTWNAAAKTWTDSKLGLANYGKRVVAYEPALTHRVAMEFTSAAGVDNKANAFLDFVPNGGTVVTTRNIVTLDNCATCHAGRKMHEGYKTELCVTCHNADSFEPFSGGVAQMPVDLQNLVHKIHSLGKGFTVNGNSFGSNSPNAGFPGRVQNCQACHVESNTAAKDAANWRTMPNSRSCVTCHSSSTAVAHMNLQISGGADATGSYTGIKTGGVETCVLCHGPASTLGVDVKTVHAKASGAITSGVDSSH